MLRNLEGGSESDGDVRVSKSTLVPQAAKVTSTPGFPKLAVCCCTEAMGCRSTSSFRSRRRRWRRYSHYPSSSLDHPPSMPSVSLKSSGLRNPAILSRRSRRLPVRTTKKVKSPSKEPPWARWTETRTCTQSRSDFGSCTWALTMPSRSWAWWLSHKD